MATGFALAVRHAGELSDQGGQGLREGRGQEPHADHRADQPGRRQPADHRESDRRQAQFARRVQQVAEHEPADGHHAAGVGRLRAVPEGGEAQAELQQGQRELHRRARFDAPAAQHVHSAVNIRPKIRMKIGVDRLERAGRDLLVVRGHAHAHVVVGHRPVDLEGRVGVVSALVLLAELVQHVEREELRAVVEAELLLRGLEAERFAHLGRRDLPGGEHAVHVAVGEVIQRAAGLLEERPEEHGEEGQDQDDVHAVPGDAVHADGFEAQVAKRAQAGQRQHQRRRPAAFFQHDGQHAHRRRRGRFATRR